MIIKDKSPGPAVVQKLDCTIHRINLYPVDNVSGFPNTYLLNSDLSGGKRYPTFEKLGLMFKQILPIWMIKHLLKSVRRTYRLVLKLKGIEVSTLSVALISDS